MQLHGESGRGDRQAAPLELGEMEPTGGYVPRVDRARHDRLAPPALGRQPDRDLEGDRPTMQDNVAQELEAFRFHRRGESQVLARRCGIKQ